MANFLYTLIVYPLYLLIEIIYKVFIKFTDSQGIAVIGVSVGITVLCLPLYAVAEAWQQVERDVQKKLKPGLERIKKAFAGDERYMMTQTFYKQNHYSPIMALRSSFGLLIQIPFFMAAYQFLSGLEALKGIPFLFIRDMGVPDATFHIGSFPVNVLPIAMTLINMVAGAVYTKGLAVREKIQVHGMAVIFLAILYNSPSGLVLYWTMNNVFSLVKNIFYKLKNPLKAFWICCVCACVFAAVYIGFFTTTKKVYKLAVLFALMMVLAAPLFAKGAQKLLDTILAPLVENKKSRHSLFFFSSLFLALLFGLLIPTSLISSSAAEFINLGGHESPFYYILNTALQAAAIFLFWFACLYFLFSKRIQALMAAGTAALAVSALLNAYPFMLSYGDISPTLVFLNAPEFKTFSAISALNLASIAAAALLCLLSFKVKKAKILHAAMALLCFSSAVISGMNALEIQKNSSQALAAAKKQRDGAGLSPIFRLSKNAPNVVLIMLDRAQSQYMEPILAEAPELNQKFSGFVFYDNVLSFNGHTLLGAPPLFGGYEYTPVEMQKRLDETRVQKVNESQLVLPRILNEKLGWTANVNDPAWINSSNYCDLSFLQGYDIEGHQTIGTYTQQWFNANPQAADLDCTEEILKRNLLFFSLFRATPIIMREAVYTSGNYYNTKTELNNITSVINNYSVLDFLPELTEFSEEEKGSYISLINELTHETFYFAEPDYVPAKKTAAAEKLASGVTKLSYDIDPSYHTQMASLKRVGEWLDFLKENGAYDNTKIVIVSDHGGYNIEPDFETDLELDKRVASTSYWGRGHYHPLLLFKDIGAEGPVVRSMDFMTNADAPSLLLKGIMDKPQNPFTKKEIPLDTRPLKKDGVFITTSDKHQPPYHKDLYKYDIKSGEWWLVKDNIFKASSWTQIEPPEGTK